jgi:hypothetical protein
MDFGLVVKRYVKRAIACAATTLVVTAGKSAKTPPPARDSKDN